jgi:hypothetical protein
MARLDIGTSLFDSMMRQVASAAQEGARSRDDETTENQSVAS